MSVYPVYSNLLGSILDKQKKRKKNKRFGSYLKEPTALYF